MRTLIAALACLLIAGCADLFGFDCGPDIHHQPGVAHNTFTSC